MRASRQTGLAELLAKYEQVIVRSLTIGAFIASALTLLIEKIIR
jgi:hypothetical protein